MARYRNQIETPPTEAAQPRAYRVFNLMESVIALPYYDENGQVNHLSLRVQGRGGQRPPILGAAAITDRIRELVRKKIIRLEAIK